MNRFSNRTAKIMAALLENAQRKDEHTKSDSNIEEDESRDQKTRGEETSRDVPEVMVENSVQDIRTAMVLVEEEVVEDHVIADDDDSVIEDDDDSVADPTYESENLSSDSDHGNSQDIPHVVGTLLDPNRLPVQNIRYTGRPRKGRKRKFEDQSRAQRKLNKNSNKPYCNYKGRKIEPKQFNNFDCRCIMKCPENVSAEIREGEFERFWSLKSYDCQVNFIAAGVTQFEKKRIYGRNAEKRKFSRTYKIGSQVVCREMYIKTLGITSFRVNTALNKFHGRIAITDQRGIKQGGHNKLSNDKLQVVVDQINRIPKYVSHYCRTKTEAKFLPPGVTIQKMYEMYCEEQVEPVSISSYKKILYEIFNLRIKPLKKDTCNMCDSLKMQIDNETDAEKKQALREKHMNHLNIAEEAQKLRREDFQKAKENEEYECLSFDLEKTLPLPRIPTNIVFYKRQLWVYNAGVHSGKEGRGYCYVWVEGVAGRGAQEIGSCLLKHIKTRLSPNVRHLLLWSDSCGGQNRNIKLTLMLKSVLHSTQLEDITLKFLCSGHSFLPNDSDFSDIESALRHQQRLYTPSEYINIMSKCRKKKPLIVTEMTSSDFVGITNIEKNIVNRKTTVTNEKINWLHIRSIGMERNEPFLLMVKQNEFSSPIQVINIKKVTRGRRSTENVVDIFNDLTSLWPNGKPIAKAKLDNLQEMMHLIPADCLTFYEGLKGDSGIIEDVDGFNVEHLDFDVDATDE